MGHQAELPGRYTRHTKLGLIFFAVMVGSLLTICRHIYILKLVKERLPVSVPALGKQVRAVMQYY